MFFFRSSVFLRENTCQPFLWFHRLDTVSGCLVEQFFRHWCQNTNADGVPNDSALLDLIQTHQLTDTAMIRISFSRFAASLLCLVLAGGLVSCKEKGPAEKAGEKVDKAIEKAADAVDEVTK